MENEKIFELMTKMYAEMQSGFKRVDERFEKLEDKVDKLEVKVEKNTMLLEKTNADIKLMVEVQESFKEQLGRAKNEEGKTLYERLDIIELAVTTTSKSVDENFIKLNERLDDMQIDVNRTTSKAAKTENRVIEFERLLNEKKQG